MLAGAAIGYAFPDQPGSSGFHASDLQVLSTIFLRLIKVLIVPLLFGTLVVGIAGHEGDLRQVGRLALRSLLYFEVVTTLALVVGLVVVNLVQPGKGIGLSGATPDTGAQLARVPLTASGMLEDMVPQSFFEAASGNQSLQVVVFSILFAVALTQVTGPGRQVMLSCCESLCQIMFKFTGIVMLLAPLGVGAAVAVTVGKSGLGVLTHLGALVATLYGALLFFAVAVLLPVALMFGVPVRRFLRAVRQPWLLAFSTASSEAALPLALEQMERLGVPRRIVAFVLPAGYSFNMDGSTLYLALAAVFVAQAAGIDMPLSQQCLMLITLMLTSKGIAAIPRAGLAVLSATLTQFNLPLSGVALILGVDAMMDMGRTSLNVVGNCLASVMMARWEGSFELREEPAGGEPRRARISFGVRPVELPHDTES